MSSRQKKLNELSVLMELRLAFGPGTRLWAHRSREELCYDWLQFKARQADANFRDFALRLYAYEKEHSSSRETERDSQTRRHCLEGSSYQEAITHAAGRFSPTAGSSGQPGNAERMLSASAFGE